MKASRNGSSASKVAKASSSDRWRRKHGIRSQLTPSARASASASPSPPITVSIATPRAVWVCGSKKISARITPSARARAK